VGKRHRLNGHEETPSQTSVEDNGSILVIGPRKNGPAG
jgi:hypothetical protein